MNPQIPPKPDTYATFREFALLQVVQFVPLAVTDMIGSALDLAYNYGKQDQLAKEIKEMTERLNPNENGQTQS